MRRVLFVVPLLVAALAACTGTTEPALPVLLAVGYAEPGGDHVALVEDDFPDSPRRLTLLEGSAREVGGEVVAMDVAERSGDRHPLFVLTRTGGGEAQLERFGTLGVRADDPGAFTRLAAPVDLNPLLAAAFEGEAPGDFCLTGLQASRSGRFVVVLDERQACGGPPENHVIVLDLEEGDEPVVVHPSPSEFVSGVPPILGVRPWLDQDPAPSNRGTDLLYYLADAPGPTLQARWLDDDADADEAVDDELALDVPLVALDDPVSLAPAGEGVVVADDDEFLLFDAVGEDADPDPVDAASGLRQLFALPASVASIVAYRTASQVHAHRDPEDEERSSVSFSGLTDGVVGPNDFLFVLAPGRIGVLDLLTFAGGDELAVVHSERIDALVDPRTLTWIRAAPAPTP